MIDVIAWVVAAELIGLASLPLAFRFFRFLPDRGLTVAKPLGLLLIGYTLWLGAFAGVLPFTRGSAVLVVALLAAAGLWLAGRDRAALLAELRARRWHLLTAEALFLLFFCAAALLRSFSPEVEGTEKPFESAFFQAVLHSETFGPRDPWFGGEPMSYYYFGYVLIGAVTLLAGTAPEIAFNLGLALTAGLAAAGAYALVFNLLSAGGRLKERSARLAALGAPLLLLVVANLEGVFELIAVHGLESPAFYRAIAIEGLTGPKTSSEWFPTDHWWWWRATRLGSGWNVEEFPFFSFLLGDLHAHVMVLPYSLLMLAATFQLWQAGPLGGGFIRRHPWLFALTALLAGNLYVTNAWDFPTALLLLGLIVLARNISLARPLSFRVLLTTALFLAPFTILAVILYLPFYIGFTAAPSRILVTEVLYGETFIERHAVATPPFQFFVFWLPLLFPAVSYLLWRVVALKPWRLDPALVALALLAGLLPVFLWMCALLGLRGPGGLLEELQARGHLTLTWLVLVPLVVLAALVLLGEVFAPGEAEVDGTRVFLAAGMLTAFALIQFPEHFFIVDIVVVSRHNTVFKFYYTAWLLLSVTGAAGIGELLAAWRAPSGQPRRALRRPASAAWAGVGLALLAVALVYPVTASLARSRESRAPRSLDGLRNVRLSHPDEYAAALWLREAAGRDLPVVLEAEGTEYSAAGRVSARTGLPTVIGWPNHEWQERGSYTPVLGRLNDVTTLYRTDNAALARELLDRYNIRYVYIGPLERERYGPTAGDTLARLGILVFDTPSVQIYAIEPASPELATR